MNQVRGEILDLIFEILEVKSLEGRGDFASRPYLYNLTSDP